MASKNIKKNKRPGGNAEGAAKAREKLFNLLDKGRIVREIEEDEEIVLTKDDIDQLDESDEEPKKVITKPKKTTFKDDPEYKAMLEEMKQLKETVAKPKEVIKEVIKVISAEEKRAEQLRAYMLNSFKR